jgi:hypothetical protein
MTFLPRIEFAFYTIACRSRNRDRNKRAIASWRQAAKAGRNADRGFDGKIFRARERRAAA